MANLTNPTPLTIGAEAEGVMRVIGENTARSMSKDEFDSLRPVLIRPRPYSDVQGTGLEGYNSDSSEFAESAQEWLFQAIRRTLARNTGVLIPAEQGPDPQCHVENIHTTGGNPYYYYWRVIDDKSARIPEGEENKYPEGVWHAGLELLLTHAMEFNPKSLAEIATVYRWLFDGDPDFQPAGPLTPTSCGYHVHVGIGEARFSAHQMRRIACVAYATGGLLSQLQPRHRKGNANALNSRYHSLVAQVLCVEETNTTDNINEVLDYVCGQVRSRAQAQDPADEDPGFGLNGGKDEAPLAEPAETYLDTGPLDFSWQSNHNGKDRKDRDKFEENDTNEISPFARRLERGSLPCEEPGRSDDPDVGPLRSIAGAVAILMRCASPAAVAELMCMAHGVEFRNYIIPSSKYQPLKPTVEFRQLPATFHPEAACAWISIVAQLVRVAIDWNWSDLNQLLRRCARSETEPQEYDVFDLLVDIGCVQQAALIQDMVIMAPIGSPFVCADELDGIRNE